MDRLSRVRPHVPAFFGAVLGVAAIAWLGLIDFGWNDYAWEANPAFDALAHGDVGLFLTLCPAYGGSFILRAPFALVPHLWGGGDLAVYRAIAVPALAGSVALAVWLAAKMRAAGQPLLIRATAIGLCTAGPVAEHALEIGHAEEIMGGLLCTAAILAGLKHRWVWAGILLGLAVATKAWALVAVTPVLLAVGPRWWRTALVSAAVTAAVLAPLALGSNGNFRATTGAMSQTGGIFQPAQLFWFAGDNTTVVRGMDRQVKAGYRTPPQWVTGFTHPLIVIVGLALPLLWLIRRRRRDPGDLVLLLALTLHLRCVLDTWNVGYYAVPMLFALLIWETAIRRRAPVLTLSATMLLWLTFRWLPLHGVSPDTATLFYLAWSLPLAGAMALRALAPERLGRKGVQRTSSAAVPLPNM